ncbi:hypothetical protein D3C77_308970 [compost metagenome]
MQLAVIAAHAETFDNRLAVHGDLATADHHALGLAGGAGGVDQVGLVARQTLRDQCFAADCSDCRAVVFQTPAGDVIRQFTQRLEQAALTEQQADAAVLNHVVQAFQRVLRVQWHISAAGLENRQQAHDHLQRAFQRQTDPHLRANAAFAQHPRQLVGTRIQLGIAQVLTGKGQGHGLWLARCLSTEQAFNGLAQVCIKVAFKAVPQLLLFVSGQHRQLAQTLRGIVEHRRQQVLPVCGHLCDARFVEQVAAVGQAAAQAIVEVGDFQVEVELGCAGVVDQVVHLHARQLPALLERPALNVAHHLEQRVVGSAARRLQRFDQLIERQVLMGLALDHGLADLIDQLAHAHLSVKLAAQHLSVKEGPNQPFAFRSDAVGHRCADAQV